MKVSLVSPFPDITNHGLRTLSAVLRQHGHPTQLLFLPDYSGDESPVHRSLSQERYPRPVVEQFLERVRDARLIGLSVMTHYVDSARQLTRAIHERYGTDKLVIWGGFHPSARPEECLHHADLVAVGEAEDLILRLVEHLEAGELDDLSPVPSLAWKHGGRVVRNPMAPLEQDLDTYPPPDVSGEDHWVLHRGALHPLGPDLLHHFLRTGSISRLYGRVGYQTMTGRGCPHCCAYCGNSYTRGLYPGERYVRFRSVEHVLGELEEVKRRLPFVDLFWFSDDSFFARPLPDLLDFCEQYARRIGVPFYLLGSPRTITEDKLAAVVEAGLLGIQMGIEHGSPRIQSLFQRGGMSNEEILRAAHLVARYTDRIQPPQYDLVYGLDYETLDDRLDTLRLIARLPKPYRLQVFSIVYYPGTALHSLAVRDGLIVDERDEIYDRMYSERHDSYTNTLLFLARGGRFPHRLLEVLASRGVARAMTSDRLAPAGAAVRALLGGFRRVARNPAVARARAVGGHHHGASG